MVWSDIRLVMAKFQEQIPRKPDLNNIKKCYYSYVEFIDSMVWRVDYSTLLFVYNSANIINAENN